MLENYRQTAEALQLSRAELQLLARNSLEAAFVGDAERAPWLAQLEALGIA
ncbi:adenosine deaminase [compost metagenome]